MDLELTDRKCLETVHSDGLISEDLDRRTSIACTPTCNHPTRNNESQDLLVPSRARLHTSYDSQFASMYRSIYAVTIRPKSLYEDVHASTGHPGYAGMQWHQKNTIGANYTDKDAAALPDMVQERTSCTKEELMDVQWSTEYSRSISGSPMYVPTI